MKMFFFMVLAKYTNPATALFYIYIYIYILYINIYWLLIWWFSEVFDKKWYHSCSICDVRVNMLQAV